MNLLRIRSKWGYYKEISKHCVLIWDDAGPRIRAKNCITFLIYSKRANPVTETKHALERIIKFGFKETQR